MPQPFLSTYACGSAFQEIRLELNLFGQPSPHVSWKMEATLIARMYTKPKLRFVMPLNSCEKNIWKELKRDVILQYVSRFVALWWQPELWNRVQVSVFGESCFKMTVNLSNVSKTALPAMPTFFKQASEVQHWPQQAGWSRSVCTGWHQTIHWRAGCLVLMWCSRHAEVGSSQIWPGFQWPSWSLLTLVKSWGPMKCFFLHRPNSESKRTGGFASCRS